LEVPHWASLLARGTHRLGPEEDLLDVSVPLEEGETEFLIDAFVDILGQEGADHALEAADHTLGPPRLWPTRVNRLVAEIDRRHRGVGIRLMRVLREVYYYLCEPELAGRVRELVVQACTERTSIVLGHSLGGVIAYDLFRLRKLPPTDDGAVRTLITCGSPLALPTVRRKLECVDDAPLSIPENVCWVNVYDPGDIVTGGQGLSQEPDIIDAVVDNGRRDPHNALLYLGAEPVAQAVMGGRR
jgi:hypothetical protein